MAMSDELERLAELRRQGVLSDEEFAEAKSRVIRSELGSGPPKRTPSPRVASDVASVSGGSSGLAGRLRSRGALVSVAALALVGLAVGVAVATSPSRATARELNAFCERLPSVAAVSVQQQIAKAAGEAGVGRHEYRALLRDECPGVVAAADKRLSDAMVTKSRLERERAARERAAKRSSGATSRPKSQPAPQPEPVYEAPQESSIDRMHRERTQKALECQARGSDYKWTAAYQCVFDPY